MVWPKVEGRELSRTFPNLSDGNSDLNTPDVALPLVHTQHTCKRPPSPLRWYRAPECLLTDGYYNYKMDMWGVGCVFFEIVSLFPLFPGTNELDQIQKIHAVLGTPAPELLAKMKKRSAHMDFNFPPKVGSSPVHEFDGYRFVCSRVWGAAACFNSHFKMGHRARKF